MDAARFSDHYNVLGLRRTATPAEVRRAYRRFVLRYHPDRNPTEANAAELFQRIVEAYQVLSNDDKRREYDALLAAFLQAPVRTPVAAPTARPRARTSGITARLRFEDEQNALQEIDGLWGATAAAFLFPWFAFQTTFVPEDFGFWLCALVSVLLGGIAFAAWNVGRAATGAVESLGRFLLRFPEAAEGLAAATPFFFAAFLPAFLTAAADSEIGFPATGLAPAILGGSFAGWVAAAVGRAFTYAVEAPRRSIGGAVGAGCAMVVGGLTGFLITAATSDVLAGARFFSLWTCSGAAGALGGALAAVRGSVRPLGE